MSALSPAGGARSPSPVPPDLFNVPTAYHNLSEVFSKDKAKCVVSPTSSVWLPNWPAAWSTPFLLVGFTTCPDLRGSRPRQKFIMEYLAAGIIRPFSSSLGVGFFFVEKKDKTLRPRIGYRGLNSSQKEVSLASANICIQASTESSHLFKTRPTQRISWHIIRKSQGVEWKTAINTPMCYFEYLVMPLGLTNQEGLATILEIFGNVAVPLTRLTSVTVLCRRRNAFLH